MRRPGERTDNKLGTVSVTEANLCSQATNDTKCEATYRKHQSHFRCLGITISSNSDTHTTFDRSICTSSFPVHQKPNEHAVP